MRYAAIAALLALVSSPAIPQAQIKNPAVKQVICDRALGSAFRIADGTFVTAAHVSANPGCEIDGLPIRTVHFDGYQDFAVVATDEEGGAFAMEYSCEGFQSGAFYFANGYAAGLPRQHLIMLGSDPAMNALFGDGGLHILSGAAQFIPGMSGGPVMNVEGKVVGIVNALNRYFGFSLSRSIGDTVLCQ
jgi:S1-C subfamily serine protease